MRLSKIFIAFAVVSALVCVASCGGDGRGFRAAGTPLVIMSGEPTTVSGQNQSGEDVDWEIPIEGGCGGPYVVEVIAGALPPGVGILDGAPPEPWTDENGNGEWDHDDANGNGAIDAGEDHEPFEDRNGDGIHGAWFPHHLQGIVLQNGTFSFRLQLTDTSCTPFSSFTRDYAWDLTVGDLRIVGANPPLIPVAEYVDKDGKPIPGRFEDIDALETVVFDTFVSFRLIVAGGVGPYRLAIADDPNDASDGGLPFGVTIPIDSTSIVGAPNSVGPGGSPFRLTFLATDAAGNTAVRKLQWKIDTPPMIIATDTLPNGKAGTPYSEPIQIADGVPPFSFELVDDQPYRENTQTVDGVPPDGGFADGWVWQPPAAPTFGSPSGFTVSTAGPADNKLGDGSTATYPADNDPGPYGYLVGHPFPPEGIFMTDVVDASINATSVGSITGVPRRMGAFDIVVHAFSALVPNEFGQHAFKSFTFAIDDSEPPAGSNPAFGIDPVFLLEGTLNPPNNAPTLPEFEVMTPYNPDSSSHTPDGLLMLGQGGVPMDGRTDGAHSSQVGTTILENPGRYRWSVSDWDPLGQGFGQPAGPIGFLQLGVAQPAGTVTQGVFGVEDANALARQSFQTIEFQMFDDLLPTGNPNHTVTQNMRLSVGPDKVIVTTSSQSATLSTSTSSTATGLHNDELLLNRFEVVSGSPQVGPLTDADMSPTHVIPGDVGNPILLQSNQLGSLLSGVGATDPNIDGDMDLLRIAINPTTWRDDIHNLNAGGTRTGQHSDPNSGRAWYGDMYSRDSAWQPGTSAVELPNYTGAAVSHNPSVGHYTNGGRLYAFESDNYFGIFIVRSDASIMVPFAMQKGTYNGFGDNIQAPNGGNQHSGMRTIQMATSPNGRLAAIKIKSNPQSMTENGSASRVVLFSLTGEKLFSGATYDLIDTGHSTITDPGDGVMFGSSMALTNRHLYFLIGRDDDTTASWQDHYIMRLEVISGTADGGWSGATTATVAPGIGANWTLTTGVPMQTPFHLWNFPSPTSTITTFTFTPSFTSVLATVTNDQYYLNDGVNFTEQDVAPMPFRVSVNGMACGLLAGTRTTSTSSTQVMMHRAWVDYDGAGFAEASTTERHSPGGGGRLTALATGPNQYRNWARNQGPTTRFEISNDGTRIAATYNRLGSVSATATTGKWLTAREDLYASSTSDNWATFSEQEITDGIFAGSHKWRFGSLCFSQTGDELIFWAGMSAKNSTSNSDSSTTGATAVYFWSGSFTGSYWRWDFDNPGNVRGVMPTAAGAGTIPSSGMPTYSAASTFNPSNPTNTYAQTFGLINPVGGFRSLDGNFFYIVTHSAISGSGTGQNQCNLLGINVSGTGTINGHPDIEGFVVQGMQSGRGFLPDYYYQPHYAINGRYYAPGRSAGFGRQVMAKDTGYVFFATHYQFRTPSRTTSATSTFSSGPAIATRWTDYGVYAGHVEGFHANVGGPIQRMTEPGLSQTGTTARSIHTIDASNDGSRLAYIYSGGGTNRTHNQEQVGFIYGIGFNPDGSLAGFDNSVTAKQLETGQGRAGESMAHDSGGTKLFYAFRAGSGNENNKQMCEMIVDPADGQPTVNRYFAGSRFSVLYSGR